MILLTVGVDLSFAIFSAAASVRRSLSQFNIRCRAEMSATLLLHAFGKNRLKYFQQSQLQVKYQHIGYLSEQSVNPIRF